MKKKSYKFFSIIFLLLSLIVLPGFVQAYDYSRCDSMEEGGDKVYCMLVEFMDSKVDNILDYQAVKDGDIDDDGDTSDEVYSNVFNGMFYSGDYDDVVFDYDTNNRQQEAIYSLAFVYQEPDSSYYQDEDVLKAISRGLDYLRRAQSEDGRLTEDGWCGVDYYDYDSDGDTTERFSSCVSGSASSAMGFTYYAVAQVINLLYDNSDFQGKLNNLADSNGDGVDDNPRQEVYACMMLRGTEFLTGSGSGHAANQDVWVLLALHAMNDAYGHLEDLIGGSMGSLTSCGGDLVSSPLISDSEFDDLRYEIFEGSPDEAQDSNALGKWFSSQGFLMEAGYTPDGIADTDSYSIGYDSNYGWVGLRGMVLLEHMDSDFASEDYLENYVDAFQYFFWPSYDFEQSGYQLSSLSRRKRDSSRISMTVSGLGQDYHLALKKMFNMSLDSFLADPDNFFDISGTDVLDGSLYQVADLLLYWQEPEYTSYELPLESMDFTSYSDSEANIYVENTDGTSEGVLYEIDNWWDGIKSYYMGSETARIDDLTSGVDTCDITLSSLPTCRDSYDSGGRRTSGSSDTGGYECYNAEGTLKEVFICKIDSDSFIVDSATTPTATAEDVDPDDDGVGNYFDDDDDNDGMPDTWEDDYGFDKTNVLDASYDTDGDGFTNLEEYTAGTNPINATSFPSACFIPFVGDWTVTSDCTIASSVTAPANVIVNSGVVLTIMSTGSFNIDFTHYSLNVRNGGGVYIRSGGKID